MSSRAILAVALAAAVPGACGSDAGQAGAGPDAGATASLAGTVRDQAGMLVDKEIAAEAKRRFGVTRVRIVHRLGRMEIGETSVAVAVSSPHRGEAFEACRFAIDTLKHKAPIWKKEFYADGSSWLEGPGGCAHP